MSYLGNINIIGSLGWAELTGDEILAKLRLAGSSSSPHSTLPAPAEVTINLQVKMGVAQCGLERKNFAKIIVELASTVQQSAKW